MDPDELTPEQRARLIELLQMREAWKRVEYVTAGAAALEDTWPQHYGLLLRQALFDHFEGADIGRLVELLAQPDTPERNAAIEETGQAILAGARDALRRKMVELRVPRDQIELFFVAHDEEQDRRAVTEDIGDEGWVVVVQMPGEIVAHNGDVSESEGSEVGWAFRGEALSDRDHVLMATSRVLRGSHRARPGERAAEED